MKKHFKRKILFSLLSLIWVAGFSQTIIKGKVVDENNLPLPGATVIIKESNIGVSTDFDGVFTINTSDPLETLVVSYLGYQTQELSNLTSDFSTIIMVTDAQSLDEVVITALGITKEEKKIGYATQKIETTVVKDVNVPNVGSLFSGQVAGLTVNNPTGLFQAPSFSLRGKNPLIVIDGVPVETDFYDVSPNDIADINVLKGTTASALYGAGG